MNYQQKQTDRKKLNYKHVARRSNESAELWKKGSAGHEIEQMKTTARALPERQKSYTERQPKAALPIRAQRSQNTIIDELSWAVPRWSEVSQNEMVVECTIREYIDIVIHACVHVPKGNCELQQQNKLTGQEVKWRQQSTIMK